MPSSANRLFLGFPLSIKDAILKELRAQQQAWKNLEPEFFRSPQVRSVPPENFHMTLEFLGQTEPEQEKSLCNVLGSANLGGPGNLVLGRCLGLPDWRSAKVFALAGEPTRELKKLHQDIQKLVVSAGFSVGRRPLLPHVSLFRLKGRPPVEVQESLTRATIRNIELFLDSLVLFRSLPTASGVRYQTVEEFRLDGHSQP